MINGATSAENNLKKLDLHFFQLIFTLDFAESVKQKAEGKRGQTVRYKFEWLCSTVMTVPGTGLLRSLDCTVPYEIALFLENKYPIISVRTREKFV